MPHPWFWAILDLFVWTLSNFWTCKMILKYFTCFYHVAEKSLLQCQNCMNIEGKKTTSKCETFLVAGYTITALCFSMAIWKWPNPQTLPICICLHMNLRIFKHAWSLRCAKKIAKAVPGATWPLPAHSITH